MTYNGIDHCGTWAKATAEFILSSVKCEYFLPHKVDVSIKYLMYLL